MEKVMLDDMIKSLKCVASQDAEGDCYADYENFMHIEENEHKRFVCGTGENLRDFIGGMEAIGCPYHQKKYGCCFEDGELFWLKDVAELLEELKSYRELEKQGLLLKLPVGKCQEAYHISQRWTQCTEYGEEYNSCEIYDCNCVCDSKKEYYIQTTQLMFKTIFSLQDEIGKTLFFTREEAENKLKEMQNAEHIKEYIEIAINALPKQIPMEPINKTKLDDTASLVYDNCNIIVCPSCGERLKLKSKGKYCDKCGQALDWGNENGKD